MLSRLRYHAMRFRGEFWYGGGILFVFMSLMLVAFPNDEDTVASFIGVLGDIGLSQALGLNLDAPAFTLWLVLFSGSYLFMIIAVTTIRMGSRILPTTDKDGMELLLGIQPRSGRQILIENWVAAQIALFVILLPTFVIISIFSMIYGATDILGRIGLMMLFTYLVGTFFMVLPMMISSLFFSRTWGFRIGMFYFVYALLILLSSAALNPLINDYLPSSLEIDISVLNINSALDPAGGLVDNKWNWTEFGVILVIVVLIVCISLIRVNSPDYLEKTGRSINLTGFLPTIERTSTISKRYPLIMEQLYKDKSYIIIYTFVIFILFPYEMVLYNMVYSSDPQAFAELINGFDIGLFDVLMGSYTLPGSYSGFATSQFFALSWIYYGVFIVIIAMNIPTRDVATETQDLIYGTSKSQREVIISRVIAMFISMSFLILTAALSNALFGAMFGFDRNLGDELLVFIFSWTYLSGLGLLVVSIAMLPRISSGKKLAFWFYMGQILIYFVGNLNQTFDFLIYLSVFNYFDPAGIALGKASISSHIIASILLWIVSLLIFNFGLKRFETQDMI